MDVNYVLPTGPQTCDVVFDWYMDAEVFGSMTDEERVKVITDNVRQRYNITRCMPYPVSLCNGMAQTKSAVVSMLLQAPI